MKTGVELPLVVKHQKIFHLQVLVEVALALCKHFIPSFLIRPAVMDHMYSQNHKRAKKRRGKRNGETLSSLAWPGLQSEPRPPPPQQTNRIVAVDTVLFHTR